MTSVPPAALPPSVAVSSSVRTRWRFSVLTCTCETTQRTVPSGARQVTAQSPWGLVERRRAAGQTLRGGNAGTAQEEGGTEDQRGRGLKSVWHVRILR